MKILILDDNKQLCDILTEILTNEGLVVDVVLSFEDALKKINYKYDVVLADYFLKVPQTGNDFLILYKQKHPYVQTILYSGSSEIDTQDTDKFLQKPIDIVELVKFIKNIKPKQQKVSNDTDKIYLLNELKFTVEQLKLDVGKHDTRIEELHRTTERFDLFVSKQEEREVLRLKTDKRINDFIDNSSKTVWRIIGVLLTAMALGFTILTIIIILNENKQRTAFPKRTQSSFCS